LRRHHASAQAANEQCCVRTKPHPAGCRNAAVVVPFDSSSTRIPPQHHPNEKPFLKQSRWAQSKITNPSWSTLSRTCNGFIAWLGRRSVELAIDLNGRSSVEFKLISLNRYLICSIIIDPAIMPVTSSVRAIATATDGVKARVDAPFSRGEVYSTSAVQLNGASVVRLVVQLSVSVGPDTIAAANTGDKAVKVTCKGHGSSAKYLAIVKRDLASAITESLLDTKGDHKAAYLEAANSILNGDSPFDFSSPKDEESIVVK
jgi:hypothetical protein